MQRFDRPYGQLLYAELDRLFQKALEHLKHLEDGYAGWETERFWHRAGVARARSELNEIMREVHHRAIEEYRKARPDAKLHNDHVYHLEISPPWYGRSEVRAWTRRGDEILAFTTVVNVLADRSVLEYMLVDSLRRVYQERCLPGRASGLHPQEGSDG